MLTLQTVVSILSESPETAVALGIVLRVVRAWQSELTWPEYRALHRLKRGVIPLLNRTPLGDRVFLATVMLSGRDHREFHATIDESPRQVVSELRDAGGSLHLINSLKRRPPTHGDPLSFAHVVWTVGDEQVEATLFANLDGSTDVYLHTETAVDDPLGHLTDGVAPGDEHGVVPRLRDATATAVGGVK